MWYDASKLKPDHGQPVFVFIRSNYSVKYPGKYNFGEVAEAAYGCDEQGNQGWLFRDIKFQNYIPIFWTDYPPLENIF